MSSIRDLPEHIIKQIAAGEVIERPSSVIKELVENSIDADSTYIEVSIRNGGKSFISVLDNGSGMGATDLKKCLYKHTTSKLVMNDLYNITTMGFRGEGLASITYVSKIRIQSKEKSSNEAFEVNGEGDILGDVKTTAFNNFDHGTNVEIRDLFFKMPARLKFLGSDYSEANAIYKLISSLAMANPHIEFKVFHNGKKMLNFKVFKPSDQVNVSGDVINNKAMQELILNRINDVMNKSFKENSQFLHKESSNLVVYGYTSIPSFNTKQSSQQHLFVNRRLVKSSFFFGCVKSAYSGIIEKGTYPFIVVFIDIDPKLIDINVSPSKTEVKFQDLEFVRKTLYFAIKEAISNPENQKTSTLFAQNLIKTFKEKEDQKFNNQQFPKNATHKAISDIFQREDFDNNKKHIIRENNHAEISNLEGINEYITQQLKQDTSSSEPPDSLMSNHHYKLGNAKAQYHKNWIIAETNQGVILVDQHAAHERITKEKLYASYINNSVSTQISMFPEKIKLSPIDIESLHLFNHILIRLGIVVGNYGKEDISLIELPSILGVGVNGKELITDIILDLKELGRPEKFELKLHSIIDRMACHGSVRSGDKLSILEMNNLLREIEKIDNAASCPHGRPTYVELKLADIEKLFNRR